VDDFSKSVNAVVRVKNDEHRELIRRRVAHATSAANHASSSTAMTDTSLLQADIFQSRMMGAISPPDPLRLPYEGALMKVFI
jgi:hypothetical protein